jgi:flagellar biosynthesis/type III secretory pathway ATPase
MSAMPVLREFLEQKSYERVSIEETLTRLNAMEL